jgi:hypothetical protein
MTLGKQRQRAKYQAIVNISKYFVKNKRWVTEEEYNKIGRLSTPCLPQNLYRIFGTYKDMLQYIEVGPMAEDIKLLKPKPAVKKPKAPAKPRVAKPAKAKESKDE